MKNRGAVRIFTVLLTLICLYYLSFSLVTWNVENEAKEVAEKKAGGVDSVANKLQDAYLDSMATKEVYPLLGYTYDECKDKRINLGLDLQGGMHVTLEVAVDRLIKELSGVNDVDPNYELLNNALALAKEKQKTSQDDYIDLFYQAFVESSGGKTLYEVFDTRANESKLDADAPDRDQMVLRYIKEETGSAMELTTDILRTRIDAFGVTQPSIREEGAGRISIELPGADEPKRVREILQSSAKLEFWETYTTVEVYNQVFPDVNSVLKDKLGTAIEKTDDSTDVDSEPTLTSEDSGDEETSTLVADETDSTEADGSDVSDALASSSDSSDNLLANDGDSNDIDTSAQAVQQSQEEALAENPLFRYLNPPLTQSNQFEQGPKAGYCLERYKDSVDRYLSFEEVKDVLPDDIKFMWSADAFTGEGGKFYTLIALKVGIEGNAALDGEVVVDSRIQFNPNGRPEVGMSMNIEGAKAWKALTGRNVGKSIAIALDGRIRSFPNVMGEIGGGQSSIQGDFSIEEAKDLANILKAGKLPLSVDIVEEAVVGPSLGKKSVDDGLMSLLIGFVLVLIFMAIYYNRGGWVANVALLANLFFIVGTLASVQAALTLPGMAGIVLTIGMSVDANVLIFERIREELKAGKGVKQAVSDGYKNALTSIVDANVTTLLTAIILYVFGKGPISGFGIILLIGIVTSFFCAVFLSRLIFVWLLEREKKVNFGSSGTMNMFSNFNWDFIGKRKIAYVVSGLIIAGGVFSLATKGLNLSVDFEGGRSYVYKFDEMPDVTEVQTGLTEIFKSQPEVKTFGGEDILKITTKYMIESEDEGIDQKVQETLETGLEKIVGADKYENISGQKVGPTFARDIKIAAIWSIIIGLIFIFVYIVLRFRKWQYGLGALVALFHDVLVVLSLFSIFWGVLPFNLEVDQAFIAAILTVVGYSINDTVVVFDRIRENLALHTRMPLVGVINGALNKTVSRTFITSVTTLLVVVVLFAFGGEIIRGFSFALLIGVLVGTYSSLFIATPIVVDLDKGDDKRRQVEEPKEALEEV